MSLWPRDPREVPAQTARVARAVVPGGSFCLQLRDTLGVVLRNEAFAEPFAVRGRPAEAPGRLALVSVLQFVEGLTDRQAADAVRLRLDWKHLLGLELENQGFDASVLCEFRARLAASGAAEALLFDAVLERLAEADLAAPAVGSAPMRPWCPIRSEACIGWSWWARRCARRRRRSPRALPAARTRRTRSTSPRGQ